MSGSSATIPAARRAPVEEGAAPSRPDGSTSIGVCLSTDHPTLQGRIRIRWRSQTGQKREDWLPHIQGVRVRRGDRVLLTSPSNHHEPVVVGVVDGLRPRQEPEAEDGPSVRLATGEALRIIGPDGTQLLEVHADDDGPRIRLLAPPAALDLPGKLTISADDLEFEARSGEVRMAASGDVTIQGEVVRLN